MISELDGALQRGSTEKRTELLRRVTDLFSGGADCFSEEQISLFGDVMSHLISHIEHRALAELSARLAPVRNAPAGVTRRLAYDDAIEVAGPVLALASALTDDELVEIAETKSQAHLAKIAGRPQLNETVTDVLVERGDTEVTRRVAENSAARFSKIGFSKLVLSAEGG